MTYAINLETLPHEPTMALYEADKALVGTPAYIGLASFWASEYKFTMRECSIANRRLVHSKLLKAGLDVSGESDEHAKIISRYAKPREKWFRA